jgi:hypothetical protein
MCKEKHGSHIKTFKKDKINDSFKTIYFKKNLGKIHCIENKFILKIYLDGKHV